MRSLCCNLYAHNLMLCHSAQIAGHDVQELLTPARLQLVQHMPDAVNLLNYILQKDPAQRPSAGELQAR